MESYLENPKLAGVIKYQSNHSAITLPSHPNLVCKYSFNALSCNTTDRYENIVKAKQVCMEHGLDLLVVPHARLIEVEYKGKKHQVCVEEKLDVQQDRSRQEEHYETCGTQLNRAIDQAAEFIALTGFSDYEHRNVPVINEESGFKGDYRLALVDLEEMASAKTGFFGPSRSGIVFCVNNDQAKRVVEIAKKHIPWSPALEERAQNRVALRKEQLADDERLRRFYTSHSITKGTEKIVVGDEAIQFPDLEGQLSIRAHEIAKALLVEINRQLEASTDKQSLKGRRKFFFNSNNYDHYPGDKKQLQSISYACRKNTIEKHSELSDKEYNDQLLIVIIARKLEEIGAIFKFIRLDGYGLYLQV